MLENRVIRGFIPHNILGWVEKTDIFFLENTRIFQRCCTNVKKYIIDENLIYLGYLNNKTSIKKTITFKEIGVGSM